MADENPPQSVPDAGKESPIEPPPLRRTAAPPAYRSSKRRRNIVILVVVLVLLVGGLFLWRYFSSYESTDDAQADLHLYPVSARISGYVVNVNVDDNQWVQQGTVLVEIDPKDYEVAVAQAKANLQAPWLGLTGFFTVAAMLSLLIFTGEAVRDAFDPRKTFG